MKKIIELEIDFEEMKISAGKIAYKKPVEYLSFFWLRFFFITLYFFYGRIRKKNPS
jgi:hypothetical protein